jgi:D-3-phosphoglycerate dehydrogenase
MPSLSADALVQAQPYIELGQKIGSLHTQLARDRSGAGTPIESVEVLFQGDFGNIPTAQITRAVLSGLLTPILSDPVNLVNAPVLAAKRGLRVTESQSTATTEYSEMLTVKAVYPEGERTICGTVFGKNDLRIVHIDGYHVDIVPEGNLVLTQHTDKPGIIGKVGTLLGDRSVNIAGMHVGREQVGGRALMALMVDGAIGEELMERIRAVPGMEKAQQVQL